MYPRNCHFRISNNAYGLPLINEPKMIIFLQTDTVNENGNSVIRDSNRQKKESGFLRTLEDSSFSRLLLYLNALTRVRSLEDLLILSYLRLLNLNGLDGRKVKRTFYTLLGELCGFLDENRSKS